MHYIVGMLNKEMYDEWIIRHADVKLLLKTSAADWRRFRQIAAEQYLDVNGNEQSEIPVEEIDRKNTGETAIHASSDKYIYTLMFIWSNWLGTASNATRARKNWKYPLCTVCNQRPAHTCHAPWRCTALGNPDAYGRPLGLNRLRTTGCMHDMDTRLAQKQNPKASYERHSLRQNFH